MFVIGLMVGLVIALYCGVLCYFLGGRNEVRRALRGQAPSIDWPVRGKERETR